MIVFFLACVFASISDSLQADNSRYVAFDPLFSLGKAHLGQGGRYMEEPTLALEVVSLQSSNPTCLKDDSIHQGLSAFCKTETDYVASTTQVPSKVTRYRRTKSMGHPMTFKKVEEDRK